MQTLEVRDVKYIYKNKHQAVQALSGVSLSFKKGLLYVIMGKSGSGKSTLLSLIAGLDNPTSGDVIIDDVTLRNIDRDKYRLDHVSVIYQGLNLFPLQTAIENVTFPLDYKKMSKTEANKIAYEKLLSVGIDESKHNRLPSKLSGGEQQRVAIARALATKTEIILADEPTGNLDTENSDNIVNLLKELTRTEDICVIIVTHDTDVAAQADVVIRINDGMIMADNLK